MHQPVKNYSSGMRSRLGFSIAAMIKPDIFIIDEVLNAGDISFYEKASAKIQELLETAKAVIVVTHNMSFVKTVCTRALWLDNGIIKFDGRPREVVEMYSQSKKH
jgi:teichoic acid transport system ATP-binding protein